MTIAQQLKIKEFPFEIKDSKGNEIYYEDSEGYWVKREYDSKGNEIYWETSTGYWEKSEYNSECNEIYYENSEGTIRDNRPKTDVQKAINIVQLQEELEEAKKIITEFVWPSDSMKESRQRFEQKSARFAGCTVPIFDGQPERPNSLENASVSYPTKEG